MDIKYLFKEPATLNNIALAIVRLLFSTIITRLPQVFMGTEIFIVKIVDKKTGEKYWLVLT